MGIFSKKKGGEGLRILSENEIRKKLYGPLLNESSETSNQNAVHAIKNSIPVQTANQTSPIAFKSSADDLFLQSAHGEKKDAVASNIQNAPDQKNRVQKFIQQEQQIVANVYPSKEKSESGTAEKKAPVIKKESVEAFKKGAAQFGKNVWKVTAFLFAIFFRILTSVDLKRKKVRQALIGAAVLAGMSYVFFSIHKLNMSREVAMTTKRSTPPVEVVNSEAPVSTSAEASKKKESLSSGSETPSTQTDQNSLSGTKSKPDTGAAAIEDVASPSEPVSDKPYSIQIATYVGHNDSDRMVNRLLELKLPAFVQPLERPGGKVYFCIFVGRYKSYAEADKALNEFRKTSIAASFQDSFVRSLKKQSN